MASSTRATSRAINAAQLVSLFLAFLMVAGVAGVLSAGFVMPAVAALGATTEAGTRLFDELPTELGSEDLSEQSTIYASDGSLLATFYAENRIVTPLAEIAPIMGAAVVAVEDRRFYQHGGVDPEGLMRAVVQNLTGQSSQGGSTLTQQYVKNVLIEAGRNNEDPAAVEAATAHSIGRKLREAKLAIALEQVRSKEEILEGYLNIAQFGVGVYGVEAASRRYFSHSALELTLPEAALLAGITQSPANWDPIRNPENAFNRRNTVLALMLDQEVITQEEHDAAVAIPIADMLHVSEAPNGCAAAGTSAYFCDYVKAVILNDPAFGATRADRVQLLLRGGLTIHTTLDPVRQAQAYEALVDTIPIDDESGISNAISTVVPGTGEIVAMAQNTPYGKPTAESPRTTEMNFNADQDIGGSSGFQTGSTFKAFVLTQWLIEGHSLSDIVDGSQGQRFPRSSWNIGCYPSLAADYSPKNLEGVGTGRMSVLSATEQSVNTAFVNMANQMDVCDIMNTAASMGMHLAGGPDPDTGLPLRPNPSMALGVNEVAPLTLAAAFATYASGGTYCKPIAIRSIQDSDGNELPVPGAECQRVLEPNIANAMNHALQEVVRDGTARSSRIDGRPSAGKTGTSNDDTNAWFVGYVPQLATAVWVGHSGEPESMFESTINGRFYDQVYGGILPAPIWHDYMSEALDGVPVQQFAEIGERELYGERKPVPSVAGLTVEEAVDLLGDAGFGVSVASPVEHETVPEGAVIGSSPGAGTRVRPGSTVTITPSAGPPPPPEPTADPSETASPEPPADDDDEADEDRGGNGNGNGNGGGGGGGGNGGNDRGAADASVGLPPTNPDELAAWLEQWGQD